MEARLSWAIAYLVLCVLLTTWVIAYKTKSCLKARRHKKRDLLSARERRAMAAELSDMFGRQEERDIELGVIDATHTGAGRSGSTPSWKKDSTATLPLDTPQVAPNPPPPTYKGYNARRDIGPDQVFGGNGGSIMNDKRANQGMTPGPAVVAPRLWRGNVFLNENFETRWGGV
ncbi:hypothetical protein GGR57DRAFT_519053 [Xylariaceae sp. FL1272]|nr:hypothetical protein GGR57DRAFT_519053 [Xylariaceae sp. FL1272]